MHKFNIEVVIKAILKKILKSAILLFLFIKSKFLYNYLIKLGITQKKQLIIDVIGLY